MSFTLLPNTGTFGDDRFDGLRSAALMALADGSIPSAVVDYLQALEAKVLAETYDRKREFARASWEQFRAQPPAAGNWLPKGLCVLMGKPGRNGLSLRLGALDQQLMQVTDLSPDEDPYLRGRPTMFWRLRDGVKFWPNPDQDYEIIGLEPNS